MQHFNSPLVRLAPVATLVGAVMALCPQAAFAIVGGELDGNAHRNVGALIYINAPTNRDFDVPRVQCSGTLIHPRIMLMAGHCTYNLQQRIDDGVLQMDDMRVSFAPYAFDPDTWLEIEAVVTHPDYDPNSFPGWGAVPTIDVGLLILKRPVRKIKPALLAPEGFLDFLDEEGDLQSDPDGTPFTIVGYGTTTVHESGQTVAPADGFRRAGISDFLHYEREWLFLSQNFSQGEGGAGYNDSGGPALWEDPDTGTEVVVGVSARGDAALVAMGIYSRIDLPETLEFIDLVMDFVD